MSNEPSPSQKKDKNTILTFPYKLWQLLDECTDGAIRWGDSGESIIIDKTIFCTSTCVQRIFKSVQWKSFVRQLNMYGFHKTLPIHQHSQEPCSCQCHVPTSLHCYTHEHFRRWNFDSLTLVTRPKTKSRSSLLNTVTENTNDVNGNASQIEPLATQGNSIKNEPQELVNWSEATVPVDMLTGPEFNLDLPERNSVDQNNAFSIDINVNIDHSITLLHPFYHIVPSMDAATWTGMTDSNKIYCQLRNISQPIPTEEIVVPFLYFSQSDDTEDLTDVVGETSEFEISVDDGVESMEVDVQIEFVEGCGNVSDRNDTENF